MVRTSNEPNNVTDNANEMGLADGEAAPATDGRAFGFARLAESGDGVGAVARAIGAGPELEGGDDCEAEDEPDEFWDEAGFDDEPPPLLGPLGPDGRGVACGVG